MLTKSEIRKVRRGADIIARNQHAIPHGNGITYACEAVGFGELAAKMKQFYNPPMQNKKYPDSDCWGDLPYNGGHSVQSQLQRELLLELFAHLKGEL